MKVTPQNQKKSCKEISVDTVIVGKWPFTLKFKQHVLIASSGWIKVILKTIVNFINEHITIIRRDQPSLMVSPTAESRFMHEIKRLKTHSSDDNGCWQMRDKALRGRFHEVHLAKFTLNCHGEYWKDTRCTLLRAT